MAVGVVKFPGRTEAKKEGCLFCLEFAVIITANCSTAKHCFVQRTSNLGVLARVHFDCQL